MNGILGKKIGMTQVFDATGKVIPVTIVEAGPCKVTQVKTVEKDGYSAVQLGFDEKKRKNTTKPLKGHFKNANTEPLRRLKEFRLSEDVPSLGDEVKVDIFSVGDSIRVSGKSIGKGFAGVIKRHGFAGVGGATHGQSDRARAGGSIGQSAYPSKVIKGMKMPGHYGNVRKTISGLKVVKVDTERNLLFVSGAVPGSVNGYLEIRKDA